MRRAVPTDAPAMARVQLMAALTGFAHIFPADAPKPTLADLTRRWQALIAEADARSVVLAACGGGSDGAIIGTAVAQPDPPKPSRGHLRSLYVLPEWWGGGVGRWLHDAAVAHLRDVRFAEASLWVLEGNARARGMYERRGWRLSADRQTVWPGVEELRYRLELGSQGSPRSSRYDPSA